MSTLLRFYLFLRLPFPIFGYVSIATSKSRQESVLAMCKASTYRQHRMPLYLNVTLVFYHPAGYEFTKITGEHSMC